MPEESALYHWSVLSSPRAPFVPYLPSGFDIETAEGHYDVIITYINDYVEFYGEADLWEHFGLLSADPRDPIYPDLYPTCFSEWYYGTLALYAEVAFCVAVTTGWASAACIAFGVVQEQILDSQYQNCLESNY